MLDATAILMIPGILRGDGALDVSLTLHQCPLLLSVRGRQHHCPRATATN